MKKIKIPIGARAAIVCTIANIFSRGLAIITMPIFTRIMSVEQIGVINLYNAWFAMISCIATLALTSGGFSVAMSEYEGKRREYISSVLSLTSIIAAVIAIIYFCNPSFWNDVTGLSSELMIMMIIGLFVSPATEFWLAYQRYEYRYKSSALLVSVSALLASALSIIVVLAMNSRKMTNIAEGRLIANNLIVYGIALILWGNIMMKGKKFIDISYWKFSLSLSLPLVGYALASQVLGVSDRMMIAKMVNNRAVGIYSTVYSVSSLFIMVWTAINSSFVPFLYQNLNKENQKIKNTSYTLLVGYSLVAILAVLLAPEIIKVLATEEYYEAIYIMPPIAIGVYMTSVANMYSNILLYVKKSKYIMYSSGIAAILNVVLNQICIPIFGYMVAAYTTMISYIIMLIILKYNASKTFKEVEGYSLNLVYDNRKILILSIAIIVILLAGTFLYSYLIFRYVIITLLIVAIIVYGIKKIRNLSL